MVETSEKRIFIAGPPKSGKMTVLKGLTGSVPDNVPEVDHSSLAGHSMLFDNKYYKARVNIWIDEFIIDSETNDNGKEEADESRKFQNWVREFTSDDAKEVREVLGAVIFTLDPSITGKRLESYLSGIEVFLDQLDEELWDGVVLIASKGELEQDARLQVGDLEIRVEYLNILADKADKNGEKDGINRLKEALEANMWLDGLESSDSVEQQPELQLNEPSETTGSDDPSIELARMLSSMSTSMLNEDSVERYGEFISKLQAARAKGQGLSHDERSKLSEELADELLGLM